MGTYTTGGLTVPVPDKDHRHDGYPGLSPLDAIMAERAWQDHKWGGSYHDRGHDMPELALILSREVGEAMEAMGRVHWPNDRAPGVHIATKRGHLRSELVQVAAVCVAIIEAMDIEDAEARAAWVAMEGNGSE